jgi:hypothetical protein
MRLTLVALPLLAALTAPTQTAQRADIQATATGDCPVGMFAQRRDSGQTMWIVSLQDESNPNHATAPQPGNTGVRVSLTAPRKSPIRQAELAVYYVAPGTHALLISNKKSPPDLKKTFHLAASDDASLHLTGDLLVGPSAGITLIHLLSLDYADGATWTAPNNTACTVEPSGLLLVDAKP